MNDASRGSRRSVRKVELRALIDDLPGKVSVRAEQLRRVRGDLSLTDIAELARELADPETAAVTDIAVCLLCDRLGVSVADARTGAILILLDAVSPPV